MGKGKQRLSAIGMILAFIIILACLGISVCLNLRVFCLLKESNTISKVVIATSKMFTSIGIDILLMGVGILLAVISIVAALAYPVWKDWKTWKNEIEALNKVGIAKAYFTQGDIKEASKVLRSVDEKSNYEVCFMKGKIEAKEGEYNKALDLFNKGLKLPNCEEKEKFYLWKGNIIFERAKELEESNLNAAISLFEDAEKLYKKAIAERENFAIAHNNLALVLRHQDEVSEVDKVSEAISELDIALKYDPHITTSYYNKACYYSLKNNVSESLKNLEDAIRQDSKYLKTALEDRDFLNIRNTQDFKGFIEKMAKKHLTMCKNYAIIEYRGEE